MKNLKEYPVYKDSGVEWLGNVPEDWEVKRLKYMVSINDEALVESTPSDYKILYVDIGNVDSAKGITKKEPMVFEKAPSRARRIVQNGDTIVSTVRTYLRAIAPIENAEDNLIVSTGFAVVRPREINSNYLSYALRSPYFVETVVSRSVGVSYPAINASDLATIEIPFPNISEQQVIADFLDRRTNEIDELIAKKDRVIELLREKRTALISHAVTKGLNPDAKMKDSGVEWLGDVPKEWGIKRLKTVLSRNGGGVWGEDFDDNGIIVLRSTEQTIDGEWCIEEPARRLLSHSEYAASRLRCGDLVVTKSSGSALHIGKTTIVTQEVEELNCCYSNFMQRLRVKSQNLPRFFYYIINGPIGRAQFVYGSNTTTGLANLNGGVIGNVIIALPPVTEQQAIADFLDRETSKIDVLAAKVTEAIEKLKEYRTALISAAVTGRIKVF